VIDVSELMRDPDFAQPFLIERTDGVFDEGEWLPTAPVIIDRIGIIQPAKREDTLAVLPEGVRLGAMIVVYCDEELRIDDSEDRRSDVIVWNGHPYRVVAAKSWADHGYWQAWAEEFMR